MKRLINLSGISVLCFLIVNCSSSKEVAVDSMEYSQPVSAGNGTPPVKKQTDPGTSETPVYGTQEVQMKRTPSFVTSNKQAE